MADKTHLDDIFEYVSIGSSTGLTSTDNSLGTSLKTDLTHAYFYDQYIDERIKYYEECAENDDNTDEQKNECIAEGDNLKVTRSEFTSKGFDRSTLDTSIALVFGNKTTIGQVGLRFEVILTLFILYAHLAPFAGLLVC